MPPESTIGMDDDREWRFGTDEVGGEITPNDEIEALRTADPDPGSPSVESAVFVALGALVTTAVILMMAGVI